MYQQLDIFDFMKEETDEKPIIKRLSVGDYIGKLVLGEIRKGKITKVEGNEKYFFYRTDLGICFNKTDRTDFDQMEKEAEEIRKRYKTIEIDHFDKFFAVEYPPRECDGRILYAMVGIYNDMLFYEEDMTYQFMEIPKNIEKAYKEKCFKITHEWYGEKLERPHKILDEPIPTRRLYWSKHGFYADAEYVDANG